MRSNRLNATGQAALQMIGMVVFALMFSTLSIDLSFYYTAHNQLRSASDAGALAGARELFASTATSAGTRQSDAKTQAVSLVGQYKMDDAALLADPSMDITFGYIAPGTGVYDPATFAQSSSNPAYTATGGYNAVKVVVRKDSSSPNGPLPSIMSRILGVNSMDTQAFAVAMADSAVTQVTGGLRPLYGCMEQFRLANLDGNPYNNVVRIFGTQMTIDGTTIPACPLSPSGNWGFADLRNGLPNAPGTSDLADWLLNGYSGSSVDINQNYSTQSGDAITNNAIRTALDTLINQQTVFLIPLMDQAVGSGSDVQARVVGFAGFMITDYKATGSSSQRYIEGRFVNAVCNTECVTGSTPTGGGLAKLRLAG